MKIETIALKGDLRKTKFCEVGFPNPEINEDHPFTMDIFTSPAGVVIDEQAFDKMSVKCTHFEDMVGEKLNYVFLFTKTILLGQYSDTDVKMFAEMQEHVSSIMEAVGVGQGSPAKGERFHVVVRNIVDYPNNAIHGFQISIFPNENFECAEHPEMLLGAPLGQYHCPECMEMVIAGIPHLPKQTN